MDSNSDQCAALLSQNEQLREQLLAIAHELDELRSAETVRQVQNSDALESKERRYREEIESLLTAQNIMHESTEELRLANEALRNQARALADHNAKLLAQLEIDRASASRAAINHQGEAATATESDASAGNSPTTATKDNFPIAADEDTVKKRYDKQDDVETMQRQLANERSLTDQLRKLCMSLLPNLNASSQFAHLLGKMEPSKSDALGALVLNASSRQTTDSPVLNASSASLSPQSAKAHSVDRDGLALGAARVIGSATGTHMRGVTFELGSVTPRQHRRRGSWPSGQLEELRRAALASSHLLKQHADDQSVPKSVAAQRKAPQFDTCSLQGDIGSATAPQPPKVAQLLQNAVSYSSVGSLMERDKALDTVDKKTTDDDKSLPPSVGASKLRQISEREYENLQLESHRARTREATRTHIIESKLANYEAQVQSLQSKVKALSTKLGDTESECEAERKQRNELENQVRVLNEQLTSLNDTATRSLQTLTDRADEHERIVRDLDEAHKRAKSELRAEFNKLRFDREKVSRELERLRRENDSLTAKHSQFTVEMQAERINLPTSVDDCHTMLLRFIDELIVLKTTKQHIEENLRTENLILNERLDTLDKQATASNREKETQQNERQELLAFIESLKTELERESKLRREAEQRFKECEAAGRDANAKLRAVRHDVDQLRHERDRLAEEVSRARQRVAQLQQELTTSESVQRDFVRLSQSLQIELEKLRQVDTDVRWQHEEDAHDCSACHSTFAQGHKSKHHCKHCGKIFCNDCLTKTVPSGPNRRSARVCDVCHTLLCKDAQPYFSRTPPSGVN